MKLEPNMYVRTDNGIIGKIYEQIGDMFTYKDNNRDYITYGLSHNEILKSSYNIIDLIEEGDYVNGFKVLEIVKGFKVLVDKLELNTHDGNYYLKQFTNNEIKSVVTKEQFSSMKYEIKE